MMIAFRSACLAMLILVCLLDSVPLHAQRGLRLVGKGAITSTPFINGTYRALVMGNDKYKDPEGLWIPLKTAVSDAQSVAKVLREDYGFGKVNLLLNATRRQMIRAFNKLAKESKNNDSVLIYYAGHGFLRESTREAFWIPVDAEGKDDSTYVPNSTIKTKLSVIADNARHVLLVSDSCFSGTLLRQGNRGVRLDDKNERYFQKVAKKKSVQILAAGGLEFVDDNYKGTGHSPFTYYFLESLRDNQQKLMEATDISLEVTRNVANNVSQSPEKGVLQGAGHAGGEFFFVKTSLPVPARQSLAVVKVPSAAPAAPTRTIDEEEEFWKAIRQSKDMSDFEAYMKEYPAGRFSTLARLKIRQLGKKEARVEKGEKREQSNPAISEQPVWTIALFPGVITSDCGSEDEKLVLNSIQSVLSSQKTLDVMYSYYPEVRANMSIKDDLDENTWEGWITKETNNEYIFTKGEDLGLDGVLTFQYSNQCDESGGNIEAFMFDIKRRKVIIRKTRWKYESQIIDQFSDILSSFSILRNN